MFFFEKFYYFCVMIKIGDNVVCKSIPEREQVGQEVFHYREENLDMKIGGTYAVVDHTIGIPNKLYMLTIVGKRGLAYYWSDYFYTKCEVRKNETL